MTITLTISGGTAAEIQTAVKELSESYHVDKDNGLEEKPADVPTLERQPEKAPA